MTQASLRPLFDARLVEDPRLVTSCFLVIVPGALTAPQFRRMVLFSRSTSSSLGCQFFSVLVLGLRSLTRPPGVLPRFCQKQRRFTRHFLFSDDAGSQFHTPEECYHFLSDDDHVCSFLACAKFVRWADPVMREPIFGEPVLTVIHAPAVALAGKSILGEEVWLNVPFLFPIGWQWPDGLLYPFLFFNVPMLAPRSLTLPPGAPHQFCWMFQLFKQHFALVMMKLPSFVLWRNAIISCPMMNVFVHFWLVPN